MIDWDCRWRVQLCFLSLAFAALGCSSDVATGRRCAGGDGCGAPARSRPAGNAGISGHAGTGGAGDAQLGSTDNALNVHVHDIAGMTIEIVTLACAGDCADITAVARGGNPPYAFMWEDGSTSARRHVCLDADAALRVRATDTEISDDEFRYEAQTASADVTAHVLACPTDAGMPPDTACDLIANPSFEGKPQINATGADFDAPPWQACDLTPDLTDKADYDGTAGYPASDGKTYLYLGVATLIGSESIGQRLCSPFPADATRYFTVDLMPYIPFAGAAVQFFGSGTACGQDALLGQSETVTAMEWTTLCVALHASVDYAFLKLALDPAQGGGLVDNLVAVDACP